MKYLIFILFILTSCKKEDTSPQICVTCEVKVVHTNYGQTPVEYIESQNQYCKGEQDTIKQGQISFQILQQSGGTGSIMKIRSCK